MSVITRRGLRIKPKETSTFKTWAKEDRGRGVSKEKIEKTKQTKWQSVVSQTPSKERFQEKGSEEQC